jgi:NTE family protein
MTRVGLVLGAGGTVGQAFHAGVLASLEHDLGWDPRTADVIVGTSAGSVTGTLLRLGFPAHDLAAWAVEAPLSLESVDYHHLLERERPPFPPLHLKHWLRRWRLPSPELLARLARRPWTYRPAVIATTMMPAGEVDLIEHVEGIEEAAPEEWPGGLWVCAARRDDGRRVVFGRRGAPDAGLHEAVAASCAIPGYFAPIRVGGVEYFDGGVHSPTNADILQQANLDLVIAVSPMSAAGGLPATADALLRYSAHRRLEKELRCLAERGTTVVRFEPAEHTLSAMGVNMMAEDRAEQVVQRAFVETGRYAGSTRIATRLAPLHQRRQVTAG